MYVEMRDVLVYSTRYAMTPFNALKITKLFSLTDLWPKYEAL